MAGACWVQKTWGLPPAEDKSPQQHCSSQEGRRSRPGCPLRSCPCDERTRLFSQRLQQAKWAANLPGSGRKEKKGPDCMKRPSEALPVSAGSWRKELDLCQGLSHLPVSAVMASPLGCTLLLDDSSVRWIHLESSASRSLGTLNNHICRVDLRWSGPRTESRRRHSLQCGESKGDGNWK